MIPCRSTVRNISRIFLGILTKAYLDVSLGLDIPTGISQGFVHGLLQENFQRIPQ